jgi:hypothetical protein
MATLFIVMAALIVAIVARTVLDPWTPSPGTQESEGQTAAQMMEAVALSSF